MHFDAIPWLDRFRHAREQSASDAVLADALPILGRIAARAADAVGELRPEYDRYVAQVSPPNMTISLELAAFLTGLCEVARPRRILDLGSGLSSYVFRTYAARAGGEATVTSVDDSRRWLERTCGLLREHRLSPDGLLMWEEFSAATRQTFDLVFHDLGSMKTRAATLPAALDRCEPAGMTILDDIHKRSYARVVRRVCRQRELRVFSLRTHTLDRFGRFAGLALPGPLRAG